MSWNDEFDKEHVKEDNFLDFPKKENHIPDNNDKPLEQTADETKQTEPYEEEKRALNDDVSPTGKEEKSFLYGGEYQSHEGNGQNVFNLNGGYQLQEDKQQNSINYGGTYQPQGGNQQNSINYGGPYQPQGGNQQNSINYGDPYQPQGGNQQNSINYGGPYQPQGGNQQNFFNNSGQYHPQKNSVPGQNYSEENKSNSNNGFAIAAFVIGLISVFSSCCFGGVIGIVSLILGIVSLSREENGKVFSIIGIVLSVISILITLLTVVLFVLGFNTSDDVDLYDEVVSNIKIVKDINGDIFAEKPFVEIERSKIILDVHDNKL